MTLIIAILKILALITGPVCLAIGTHHVHEALKELKSEESFQSNFVGPLVFFFDWFTDEGKKHRALAIRYVAIGAALIGTVLLLSHG